MKIYIKYMVCLRCKLLVIEELKKLGLQFTSVELGVVDLVEDISSEQRSQFKNALINSGLELMDDKKTMLVEKIKIVIIEMIHQTDEVPKVNFSNYLSEKLNYDYTYLSNLFSEVEGTTIGHFILVHKIEKIKEYIIYDELNLTEIAYKLNYSSIGALSNQFKKITGLTPTYYKHLTEKHKMNIEDM